MSRDDQIDLFKWQWPPARKYPLNNELGKVGKWVKNDLEASDNFLILTGFSSLAYLIEQIGDEGKWKNRSISIVLGNEPITGHTQRFQLGLGRCFWFKNCWLIEIPSINYITNQ